MSRTPDEEVVEDKDVPVQNRRRFRAWASNQMGGLPRPLLGSSERRLMLEDARRLEKDAESIYKKTKVLNEEEKEAELLMEQAYQKRVLCAPIRSLPLETLSQVLTLATAEDFVFHPKYLSDEHPLSAVSRTWRYAINTTPEIWSRIHILIPSNSYLLEESLEEELWQDAERRLPFWLARARNTDLEVALECSRFWTPLQAIWSILLSRVGSWRTFYYRGPPALLAPFWENTHSAVRLEIASIVNLNVTDPPPSHQNTEQGAGTKPSSYDLQHLPRLHRLVLSNSCCIDPVPFITEQLPFATQVQDLMLRNIRFSSNGLAGVVASFPSITKLHLEDASPVFWEAPSRQVVAFKHLERFELSQSLSRSGMAVLPALEGCCALSSLRLQLAAFQLADDSCPLPSVESLDLELSYYTLRERFKLQCLLEILPSLKSLKVAPVSTRSADSRCKTRSLLEELSLPEGHPDHDRPLCLHLSKVSFQGVAFSNRNLVSFIEGRTFNATPDALKVLEECGEGWFRRDLNPDVRYAEWKPTCVVTTLNCPGTPDMLDAGLQVLVDNIKSGKLSVHVPDDYYPDCDAHCACGCGDYTCHCCEHHDSDEESDS